MRPVCSRSLNQCIMCHQMDGKLPGCPQRLCGTDELSMSCNVRQSNRSSFHLACFYARHAAIMQPGAGAPADTTGAPEAHWGAAAQVWAPAAEQRGGAHLVQPAVARLVVGVAPAAVHQLLLREQAGLACTPPPPHLPSNARHGTASLDTAASSHQPRSPNAHTSLVCTAETGPTRAPTSFQEVRSLGGADCSKGPA